MRTVCSYVMSRCCTKVLPHWETCVTCAAALPRLVRIDGRVSPRMELADVVYVHQLTPVAKAYARPSPDAARRRESLFRPRRYSPATARRVAVVGGYTATTVALQRR